MSRTYKDRPRRIRQIPDWSPWSIYNRGGMRFLVRKWWHGVRGAERAALAHGEEPEPVRPRHSVEWEVT